MAFFAKNKQAQYDAFSWPIGAALLQFSGTDREGNDLTACGWEEWRPTIREVARAGFEHIDLTDSWLRPGDLSERQIAELIDGANEFGLGFSAISVTRKSIIDPDQEIAAANMAYAHRTIDAAAAMGIGTVCLGLHRPLTDAQKAQPWFWLSEGEIDIDEPANWRRAVNRFRALGSHAAELGIEVSLEMYEDTLLGSADSAVKLVQEVGLANVGLNPDIGNIVRLHRQIEDWESMLEKTLPHTNYWQVKNYFRDYDPSTGAYSSFPASMEAGYVNYREAIGMALEAGFTGPFCVEHYGGDGLTIAAGNREYIRELLAVKLEGIT